MPEKDNMEIIKHYTLSFKLFFQAFWKTILAWIVLVTFVVIAIHYNVDKSIIGGSVVIFGIISQAFIGLINIIGLVPLIGPIIAKVLALPLFWLINAFGYFVSIGTAVFVMAILMLVNNDPSLQEGGIVIFTILMVLAWIGFFYLIKDKIPFFKK